MNVRAAVQPPPVGLVSVPCGVMLHEFCPKHVALTTLPLPGSAPTQVPAANGPAGHAPVGLP
jgi:hypothetical protein